MSEPTRRLTLLTAAALLAQSAAAARAVAGTPATTDRTTDRATAVLSPPDRRRRIVARANRALTKPTPYRLTRNGTTYLSKPRGDHNHLGGKNLNAYNDFNGRPWSGHFAAAMWNKRGLPSGHQSARRWRTGVGSRFHPYDPRTRPQPGDVLVWSDTDDERSGHVAVVVAVRGGTVITVEGDTGPGGDSVTRRFHQWTDRTNSRFPGPHLAAKDFRGFTTPG
ncbi:CHAP domain-containing protein [Streptomyces sp. TRM S81-3]|uniref:CHAP domain-containing protein n=1 Tax=Streptomyces griseicoloratus TaxID=2752516 RepID=A0A926L1N7_9ACTN|nr:CHAP domain-containing protein [Streptomyces griseicoloratus]MBD0418563.1 CHAP domain-containing protein [Streptomyces griseicoloratus]